MFYFISPRSYIWHVWSMVSSEYNANFVNCYRGPVDWSMTSGHGVSHYKSSLWSHVSRVNSLRSHSLVDFWGPVVWWSVRSGQVRSWVMITLITCLKDLKSTMSPIEQVKMWMCASSSWCWFIIVWKCVETLFTSVAITHCSPWQTPTWVLLGGSHLRWVWGKQAGWILIWSV